MVMARRGLPTLVPCGAQVECECLVIGRLRQVHDEFTMDDQSQDRYDHPGGWWLGGHPRLGVGDERLLP